MMSLIIKCLVNEFCQLSSPGKKVIVLAKKGDEHKFADEAEYAPFSASVSALISLNKLELIDDLGKKKEEIKPVEKKVEEVKKSK